jgi:hypothetical protein
MNDRIRTSDADRERVTARLREHFAEGRLTSEELDERVAAALSARTFGDLRRVMADLPEPAPAPPVPPRAGPAPAWAGRHPMAFRRGPRILPLALIALVAVLVIPGAGWLVFAAFKLLLLFWLVACVAGLIAAARFRRHVRRHWQSGTWQSGNWPPGGPHWRHYEWRG